MRPRILACSIWLGLSIFASAASAVTLATVQIGDVGNAADTTGYGSVGYDYAIGTYEVTKQWSVTAEVSNATDKVYYPASYASLWIAPGAPRQYQLRTTYRFF